MVVMGFDEAGRVAYEHIYWDQASLLVQVGLLDRRRFLWQVLNKPGAFLTPHFITGQTPKRTGLSKVGIPGATVGLQDRDITIAQALKPLGYATGQFGKNHLGDRDEYLPTNHGFDEFFGNLYHLNAEEEPQGGILRDALSWRISGLDLPVCLPACSKGFRSPRRPLRACRCRIRPIRRLEN
jgi:hypothetical protein